MRNANSISFEFAAYRIQLAEKWNHSELMVAQGLCSAYQAHPLRQSVGADIGREKIYDQQIDEAQT